MREKSSKRAERSVRRRSGGRRADFHVSPDGSDENPGTANKPFATLAKARDAVREKIARGMNADVTVVLRGGGYFVSKPVRFDDRDSGRGGHCVVYKAAPGEEPIIYGGRRVTGWRKWKDGVYRAKVGRALAGGQSAADDRVLPRLFENGRVGVLARYPKKGSGYGGVRPVSHRTVRIPRKWAGYDFDDARVFAWIGPDWSAETREVTGVSRKACTLTVRPFSSQMRGPNRRMYIEGVLELLDEPGEWCLKRKDGCLYYRPRRLPIEDQPVVLTNTSRILDVRGRSRRRPVSNIRLEGLTFVGSHFAAGSGLIHVENAAGIRIKFCKIIGAGWCGVLMNKRAEGCTVYGCWIEGAGFAGVAATGFRPGKGPFRSAAASYVNRHHVITNNYITDCGQLVGHGRGVEMNQSGHNEVSHNLITRMPRYGIAYGGTRFGVMPKKLYGRDVTYENHYDFIHTRNNAIRFNEIANVCRDSHDFGAIEAWGPGRDNVWEYNAIHDVDPPVGWDKWAHMLFPDDGADHHTLRGNIVYECKGGRMTGAVMMKSIDQVFENNIVADNAIDRVVTLQPYVEPAADAVIRRNIFCCNTGRAYATKKDSFAAVRQIDGNLIHPACGETRKYNKHGWDLSAVHADPLFDRKHAAHETHYTDFKLKPNSPAFKLGFRRIPVEKIGLKADFPFDRKLIGRRRACDKIQAEDYDRMRGLRAQGATCISHMEGGSWAKYENVDFGCGRLSEAAVRLSAAPGTRIVLRLDAPNGRVIGRLTAQRRGWREQSAKITAPKGIHTLFLVFHPRGKPAANRVDWFRFQQARRGDG